MKKVLIASFAALALSVTALASAELTNRLNAELLKILLPFNNEITQAKLEFRNVEQNATNVLDAELVGFFQKVGPNDTANLIIDTVRYESAPGKGQAPLTTARASLNLNFANLVGQDTINDMVPDLPEIVAGMIAEQAGAYKDALVVNAQLDRTDKDADGNFVLVTGNLTISVDFAKLPQNVTKEDVPATEASLNFEFQPTKGISMVFQARSNPDYKGFRADQKGLKEYLELLLTRDTETLEALNKGFTALDQFANRVTGNE